MVKSYQRLCDFYLLTIFFKISYELLGTLIYVFIVLILKNITLDYVAKFHEKIFVFETDQLVFEKFKNYYDYSIEACYSFG